MHKQIVIKYLALSCGLVLVFGNFVACGSQLYQVSMKDDFNEERSAVTNPEVSDKESTVYGIHSTNGWKSLPIYYKFGNQVNEEQRIHLRAAMKMWEVATGKKLFKIKGTDKSTGDSFDDLYSSLDDSVNGHYLDDDWAKTKKPDYVLATAIWHNDPATGAISTADIRFNNESYIIGDSLLLEATEDKEVVDMQSLALHEIGHLLGLAHIDEDVDDLSIMNPTLYIGEGLISRELSQGDIERIQTIYGCEGAACNIGSVQLSLKKLQESELTDPLEAH